MNLLIILNICHWLADYTHLSNNWMLSAKRIGSPLLPIFVHAMIHAILMGIAMTILGYTNYLIGYAVYLQLFSHFIIDVMKGKLNVWYPTLSDPANKFHWYIFGLDQLLHQIVIILMVKIVL